ncbi:hypothetical protein CLAFUW4_10714 [Fulvia fulva]|uniref:Uncharacterized protein n=1 Tax=Passalora fulva TaxID=5499 RepID=A0A9Q8LG36_PASFU|nr:uncharacterized protein CLAFUR5_05329 [Fulvia fulva]KAK4615354.1 hypothetical protein CLAFUR4_10719 [Fulvia fulva]KAK4617177.1 hypothetical protein CLAFUR0_10726 [Fulvia fulva]UJO16781.1 hypothetical protein CLAFUR5_05329 [Fulvia fulva]WPV19144.1 hypothetical protein CLAFUW4_10714 [Fulvia fulva]WPV34317.1 hypothetical protein CLAFUW7_10716 [Fulvia fulva]
MPTTAANNMAPNNLNNTADVYVIDYQGLHQHVGKGINKTSLMLLSISAHSAFQTQASPGKAPPKTSDKHLFLLHEDKPGAPSAEPEAARIVCKWIDSYDPNKPIDAQVLTLDHIPESAGGPTLQQVVHLYHTAYAFRIDRQRRGNVLREAISDYIHNGPLSENEFRMLHDLLAFDDGTLKSAQHSTMHSQIHGCEPSKSKDDKQENKIVQDKDGKWHVYARPDPQEFEKIVAFAKGRGIWEGMEDAKRLIVCQKEQGLLSALQFQTREAHRLKDHKKATALRAQMAVKQALIKQLKEEMAAIGAAREAKEKARLEAAKKADEARKKKAEQEEARKQSQKPK